MFSIWHVYNTISCNSILRVFSLHLNRTHSEQSSNFLKGCQTRGKLLWCYRWVSTFYHCAFFIQKFCIRSLSHFRCRPLLSYFFEWSFIYKPVYSFSVVWIRNCSYFSYILSQSSLPYFTILIFHFYITLHFLIFFPLLCPTAPHSLLHHFLFSRPFFFLSQISISDVPKGLHTLVTSDLIYWTK